MSEKKPLVIVGAGPKAAAIAAKRYALVTAGYQCPEILIIEKSTIGANWNGNHGYTDGLQRLGTPPEKDVGFPYSLSNFAESKVALEDIGKIIEIMITKFSWQSYRIFHKRNYGGWLDRGRPHPIHRVWSEYICWVIQNSDCDVKEKTTLSCIEETNDGWKVTIASEKNGTESIDACGLVITGPGPSKKPNCENCVQDNQRIMFGDSFWTKDNIHEVKHACNSNGEDGIIVVGGGETAASIVSTLIDIVRDKDIPIYIYTRSGTIFSRGEGYYENRVFTNPEGWNDLSEDIRKEIINRGDRGVFSVDISKKIALTPIVEHRNIEITGATVKNKGRSHYIQVQAKDGSTSDCRLLIFAFGFDSFWFSKYMDTSKKLIFETKNEQQSIINNIKEDLSVKHDAIKQKLHLPMVAGFSRGPGFPNLSCLGTLSDVVLAQYVEIK